MTSQPVPPLNEVIDDVVSTLADRLGLHLTDTDRRQVASEYRVRALAVTWRNHARHMTIRDYVNGYLSAGADQIDHVGAPIGRPSPFDATATAVIRNEHRRWWRTFAFGDRHQRRVS